MTVTEISSAEQFDQILKSNPKVAVDFTATWCGPCRIIGPVFAALSEAFQNVVFVKVDVDKVPDVSAKYGIRAMPTFIMFKDGEKSDEIVGANKAGLEEKIKAFAA